MPDGDLNAYQTWEELLKQMQSGALELQECIRLAPFSISNSGVHAINTNACTEIEPSWNWQPVRFEYQKIPTSIELDDAKASIDDGNTCLTEIIDYIKFAKENGFRKFKVTQNPKPYLMDEDCIELKLTIRFRR